ncbi:MAG: NAD(P)-binding domain-containing protein [Acidobacteriota bacterium]
MQHSDVIVIGAGPIGIEMAVALKGAGISYRHFEAAAIGATIAWYAPQTHFFSSPERIAIAGVPLQTQDQSKATREEYLLYLRNVVLQFGLEIATYEPVTRVTPREGGGFAVTTVRRGRQHHWSADRVVLAIGDMHQPRRLGIAGEDLPHVSHYLGEPHRYFGRRVLVVGGKNSAVEAVIRLQRVGASPILSYRGEDLDPERIKFWLMPDIRALIRDRRVPFLPSTVPSEILPDRVRLASTTGGDEQTVAADDVLLMTGYTQDPTLFEQAGIVLEGPGKKPRHDEATMETNVPGLFVAGTGAAGTQLAGVKAFIETSHVHVDRILATITGQPTADLATPTYELPES